VDDVIVFTPLQPQELRRIVDLQLKRVEKMTSELGVALEVTDAARDWLARQGYDPAFGARPLKRLIQRQVQDPLALHILDSGVEEGARIRVDVLPGGEGLGFAPGGEGTSGTAESTAREEVAGRR
jgi:ATP-dependent Clp protease ATP-binding subunit ClpB